MKKLSFWIILLLILSCFASAVPVTLSHGTNQPNVNAHTASWGGNFSVDTDTALVSIGVNGSCAATHLTITEDCGACSDGSTVLTELYTTTNRIGDNGVHRVYAAAVDDENQTIMNYDNSLVEAYHNFTIVNTAPTAPNLLYPVNGDAFGVLPEFNWSNSYDVDNDEITYSIEIDNNSTFTSLEYANASITEDVSGVTGVLPTLPIRYNYYWRVRANDGNLDSDWSSVRNFTYAMWNITFNVTSSKQDVEDVDNLDNITCNYVGFSFDYGTTNPYGPYGFPPGNWECTFEKTPDYFNKIQTFTTDDDKIVNVIMPERGGATYQEHTWLEALYNCIILEDCSLWNILREINQTTGYIWQHIQPTDQSVLTTETISEVVNSTHNITYDAMVNVPIKQGYGLGDYLPIRIGYWFIDKYNASKCFSQGNPPSGIELIEPYCQPLIVQTMGPMGGSVKFRVDLRPNLTIGTYNITRRIEIDPNNVWVPYGHEVIGQIKVTEDSLVNPTISMEDESYIAPDKEKETVIIRESSGGGGGGGGSSSPSITTIYNIYNVTKVVKENSENKEGDEENREKEQKETQEYAPTGTEKVEPKRKGLSQITGAAIGIFKDLSSESLLVGIIILLFTIIIGLAGYIYGFKKR